MYRNLVVFLKMTRSIIALLFLVVCAYSMSKPSEISFVPAKLPCSFRVLEECNVFVEGSTQPKYTEETEYFVDGQVFAHFDPKDYSSGFGIQRVDLMRESQGGLVYPVISSAFKICSTPMWKKEEAQDFINHYIGAYYQKQVFESVNETTFQGKKCKAYFTTKPTIETQYKFDEFYLFADDENNVLGYEGVARVGDSSLFFVTTPTFSEISSLDIFAVKRSDCPDLEDDAYIPPKEQC